MTAGPLLEGKVCVVSGAGPGLGRQAALLLASHGASVVLGARRSAVLDEVAADVEAAGGQALPVPTDIRDPEQCEHLLDAAASTFGGVDAVINNAFRFDVMQTFEDVDLDAWRKIVETNLFGSLQVTKAAIPHLRRRGGGSVVMVASMVTRRPAELEGGYAVSKGALLTATRVLAFELGAASIRVNAVVPGWMLGPSVEIYIQLASEGRGVERDVVTKEIEDRIPSGRIPTDGEVAGTIVYLVSDLSAAVTGQAIDANGGEHFA